MKRETQKEKIARLEAENAELRQVNEPRIEMDPRAMAIPEPTGIIQNSGGNLERYEPRAPVQAFAPIAPTNETATALAAAQARAQVEARFLVALNRPRNPDASRIELLRDCRRPIFAEVATYSRPVGGDHKATGPSIRFAEAAARAWGNIDIDARTIYESTDKRIVAVKVTNLESNVTYGNEITINKTVERRKLKQGQSALGSRTNSSGQTVYLVEATEDDMLQKSNALISKAIRVNIMRHLPGDLVDEALNQCRRTLSDQDRQDPDAARKRILDSFASLNVPIPEIGELLGHDIGQASPKEIEYLRGVYTAIREGDTNWYDIIETVRADRGTDGKPSEGGRAAEMRRKILEKAKQGRSGNGGPTAPDPRLTPRNSPNSGGNPAKPPAPGTFMQPTEIPGPATAFDRSTGEVPPDEEPPARGAESTDTPAPKGNPEPSAEMPFCQDCGVQMEPYPGDPDYAQCSGCKTFAKIR